MLKIQIFIVTPVVTVFISDVDMQYHTKQKWWVMIKVILHDKGAGGGEPKKHFSIKRGGRQKVIITVFRCFGRFTIGNYFLGKLIPTVNNY